MQRSMRDSSGNPPFFGTVSALILVKSPREPPITPPVEAASAGPLGG
jgi:hypothetical protein